MELNDQLKSLQSDLAGFIAKQNDELKSLGNVTNETKSALENLQKQLDAVEVKMAKPGSAPEQKSFATEMKENESVQRLIRDRKGRAVVTFKGLRDFEAKTTMTTSAISTSGNDSATSGVLMFDRTPGVVAPARKKLFLGDLLTRIPTEFNAIDYVKVETDVVKASPQVEAASKYENALSFTTASANVRTIATWIRASKQILSDFKGLEAFVRSSLGYSVKLEEETQLIAGDNTGENLNGLLTQASAFNTGLLVATDGWEYADQIGRTIQQIELANEMEPSFVVLPPSIWWSIRLQKTSTGEYVYGNPAQGDGQFNLFGLQPIRSNVISNTKFLVGSAAPTAAVIRDREEMTVELSTEDNDNFTKNMVTIRAEERVALVVMRPASYITGTFSQSPA